MCAKTLGMHGSCDLAFMGCMVDNVGVNSGVGEGQIIALRFYHAGDPSVSPKILGLVSKDRDSKLHSCGLAGLVTSEGHRREAIKDGGN